MKKRAIIFPFFNPPKNPIKLSSTLSIKKTSRTDLNINYEYTDFNFYGFEHEAIRKKYWAILEGVKKGIQDECYIALLDLYTKHWRYEFKRTDYLNYLKIPFGGKKEEINIPKYIFNKLFIENIKSGLHLLSNRRFSISLLRWYSSYKRTDPLDIVLDCCSALEALFSLSDELRLRIALSVYHILIKDKKQGFLKVYEMYGIRNNFIHGNKIPDVTSEQCREYVEILSKIFTAIVTLRELPDSKKLTELILDRYSK